MSRKEHDNPSHGNNFDKNSKPIELVFIWDGTHPDETYIAMKKEISILDNIKNWCESYPNFSVKLWIGPNMNDMNKAKMQAWLRDQKITNLELKYIPRGLDEMADYESMGPFPNYAAASDRWRIHICAMEKKPETIRIYMDTDNQPEKHDTFISEITEKADKKGIVFYRSVNEDKMSFWMRAGNSFFIVSDIKKFKYFVESIKKRLPWMFSGDECNLGNVHRITYLHARYSNVAFRMTVESSGPHWFILCALNFIEHEEGLSYRIIPKQHFRDEDKINFYDNDKDEKVFCKEYFIEKGVKINFSNTWLCCNDLAPSTLPIKCYSSLEELKKDIVYRIFIEIKIFNDFNLPYSLLLAYRYKRLFREVSLDVFAGDICKGVLQLFSEKEIATDRIKVSTKKMQWLLHRVKKRLNLYYARHRGGDYPTRLTDDIENIKIIAENEKIDRIIEKTSKYFEVKPIRTQSIKNTLLHNPQHVVDESEKTQLLREQNSSDDSSDDNDRQGCCCVM